MPSICRSLRNAVSNSAMLARMPNMSLPCGLCRVQRGVIQHLEPDTPAVEFLDDLVQMCRRPGQPIDLGHHYRVTLADVPEHLSQFGPILVQSRQPVLKEVVVRHPGSLKLVDL